MFNLAIDSKLRGCDLVSLRVRDIAHGNQVLSRAMVVQSKTQRPVQFELTEPTRTAVLTWLEKAHLRNEDFERLHFDKGAVEATAERLRPFATRLAEKMRQVFGDERAHVKNDVDASLYDGFIADGDKRRMAEVRATPPEHLDKREFGFKDPRLQELLFRYRARNWPGTLTQPEQLQWDGYRRQRLVDDAGWSEATFDSYEAEIATLRLQHAGDGARQSLLDHLQTWGQDLRTELAV